jgi:gliding motility-associated-like protein
LDFLKFSEILKTKRREIYLQEKGKPMRKIVLLFVLFICCIGFVNAQQLPGQCPPGSPAISNTCANACVLCDFTTFTSINNTPPGGQQVPPNFCPNQQIQPHNVQWVGFVAGTTSITMNITPSGCTLSGNNGLQVGIWGTTDCSNFTLASNCVYHAQPNQVSVLTANNLTVGGTYFLVVDGYNDDVCNFTVNVVNGSTVVQPITAAPQITLPPGPYCAGGLYNFISSLVPNAGVYNWTLNGQAIGTNRDIQINIPGDGSYTLCVTPANVCHGDGQQTCVTIEVGPLSPLSVSANICDGQTYSYQGNSFTNTGNYGFDYTTPQGCTQPVQLDLTVYPNVSTQLQEIICPGESVQVGTQVFTQTGNFSVSLRTAQGCDSIVTLDLEVDFVPPTVLNEEICSTSGGYQVGNQTFNTSGQYILTLDNENGCDSIVALNLQVFTPTVQNIADTICQGEFYQLGFSFYNATGVYQQTVVGPGGCENEAILNLTVSNPQTTLNRTVCAGQSVTVGNSTYNTSGTYVKVLTGASSLGCDSTVTLNLSVLAPIATSLNRTICASESFTVGNNSYSTPGTFTTVLTASNGCDSTVTLNLVVNPEPVTNLNVTVCAGESYSVGGSTYNTSGIYQNVLNSVLGCDSTVNLNLTVLPLNLTPLSVSICDGDSYTVGNTAYAAAGAYTDTLTAANGCDSIIQLALSVIDIPRTALNVAICQGESYAVGGSSYTATGIFIDTLTAASGCDSIVTLELGVIPPIFRPLSIQICPGQSYTLGGSTYSDAGNYSETFVAASGCDSIVNLTLTVTDLITTTLTPTICNGESFTVGINNYTASGTYENYFTTPAGCDSLVILNLNVLPTPQTTLNISICNGDSFGVGNSSYSTGGVFTNVLTAANGCDSTVTLNLTILPTPTTPLIVSICNGESYAVGTSTYSQTGNYTNVLSTVSGCDSTVVLSLTVLDTPETTLTQSICNGESFSVGASSYSASGTYTNVLTAANGCDSTVTLNLTVLPTPSTALSIAICDGESFSVGNSNYSTTGTYTNVLTAANGCDSTVTLNLLVNPIRRTNIVASICELGAYVVGNSSYNQTGNYVDTLTAVTGCDSIVRLALTVTSFYETNLQRTICDGESTAVGGSVYTSTGNYQNLFTAQDGCDSIVNLSLTVLPIPVTNLTPSICQGQSFSVGASTYTVAGNYQNILTAASGCDSIVNTQLTIRPVFATSLTRAICQGESFPVGNTSYTASGVYTNTLVASNGCDSTVTLSLTVNPIPVTNLVRTICAGESFTVGNSSYATTGNYQVILSAFTGCDSIVNLNLTVRAPITTTLNRAICQGATFTVGASTYNTSGTYTNVLTSVTGCDSTVTLNLVVNPVYEIFLTERICDDQTFTVGNTSFSSTGNFQVILSSVAGCDSIVNLALTTHPCTLQFTTGSSATNCFGSSNGSARITMTVGTAPYTYTWQALSGSQSGSGTIPSNNVASTVSGLPAGDYRFTVTDFYGVVQTITVTVSQPPPVTVTLNGSNYNGFGVSCPGATDGAVTATVNGGNAPYSYLWSTGSTQAFLRDVPAGIYTLTLTDANGCISTPVQPRISLSSPPVAILSITATDPPCFGQTQGSISIDSVRGGAPPFLFALDNGAFSNRTLFAGLSVGNYAIRVQDANGCIQEFSAEIDQPAELIVDLGSDIMLDLGDSVRLEANTSYPVQTYQWQGTGVLSCTDCATPTVRPFATGIFSVTVIDRNGCTDTDRITIFVDKNRDVFFPTAFSPNDDGINDRFYPFTGKNVSAIKSFLVFNRWGEAMFELFNFEPNNPSYGWDGTHRGKTLNPGVYVFVAEIEFIDGEVIVYKGDVSLMR